MKRILGIAAVSGFLAAAPAFAGVDVFVGIGAPAPVYMAPAPVYLAPAPVYAAPVVYRHDYWRRHDRYDHRDRRDFHDFHRDHDYRNQR